MKNRRVMEPYRLGGISFRPSPCSQQGWDLTQPSSDDLQIYRFHNISGQSALINYHRHDQNIFLISNWNFLSCSLSLLSFVLLLSASEKCLFLLHALLLGVSLRHNNVPSEPYLLQPRQRLQFPHRTSAPAT